MWRLLVLGVFVLVLMEGVVWYVLRSNDTEFEGKSQIEEVVQEAPISTPEVPAEKTSEPEISSSEESKEGTSGMGNTSSSDYPKITTEIVNGRTERTIHMGVRKWVWEPSTLRVKQGELVRLVIHNADVRHPLVIPALGIEADVPPEGAVVEFEAKQKGSFDFLCAAYCGVGHAEMQGTLIVE